MHLGAPLVAPRVAAQLRADYRDERLVGMPAAITPPGEAIATDLRAVACSAPGSCTAVGDDIYAFGDLTDSVVPAVVTETAGIWGTPVELPVTGHSSSPSVESALLAVQCVDQSDCQALGTAWLGDSEEWLAYTETAGSWSAPTVLPTPPTSDDISGATSMACVDQADCTAVSIVNESANSPDPETVTMAWIDRAGTWGQPVALDAPDSFDGDAVACPSAARCLVVGTSVGLPAYTAEVDGSWGPVHQLALPRLSPRALDGELVSIACPSATLCVAGADYTRTDTTREAGSVTWSDGMWSSGNLLPTASGTTTLLGGISCPTTAACVVDGVSGLTTTFDSTPSTSDFAAVVTPTEPVTTPGAPDSVHVLGAGVTALTAQWTPPTSDGGAPVTSYTAKVLGTALGCTTRASTCTIAGLNPSRSYVVAVTDTTAGGTSPSILSQPVRPGRP